jgi:hypothetical protein
MPERVQTTNKWDDPQILNVITSHNIADYRWISSSQIITSVRCRPVMGSLARSVFGPAPNGREFPTPFDERRRDSWTPRSVRSARDHLRTENLCISARLLGYLS